MPRCRSCSRRPPSVVSRHRWPARVGNPTTTWSWPPGRLGRDDRPRSRDRRGTILRLNAATGILTVPVGASRLRYPPARRPRHGGLSRPVGHTIRPIRTDEAAAPAGARPATVHSAPGTKGVEPKPEALEGLQWDPDAVGAGYLDSHLINQGSPKVTVGVSDSGIDISHPGPGGRRRPVPVQDSAGHGTQVAGHIAAAINGLGVSGVAPGGDYYDNPGQHPRRHPWLAEHGFGGGPAQPRAHRRQRQSDRPVGDPQL